MYYVLMGGELHQWLYIFPRMSLVFKLLLVILTKQWHCWRRKTNRKVCWVGCIFSSLYIREMSNSIDKREKYTVMSYTYKCSCTKMTYWRKQANVVAPNKTVYHLKDGFDKNSFSVMINYVSSYLGSNNNNRLWPKEPFILL